MRILIFVLISLMLSLSAGARNITFDDLYSIPRYGDVQISPDGKMIVFELTQRDLATNSSETHLWLIESGGGNLRQLTNGDGGEWHPRWEKTGREIFFICDRENMGPQVWRISKYGGEAQRMTSITTGVSDFDQLPYASDMIIVSRVFPECHNNSCNQARMEKEENSQIKARLFNQLLYRHYNRWDDGKVSRLIIHSLSDCSHRELYASNSDVPATLLGGYGGYDYSPDGKEICFVMNDDSVPAIWPNNDLYIIPTEGGEPVRITDNKGLDTSPQYSPDGKYIAYHSMARAGYESDQRDLVLFNRETHGHINVTSEFDRSIGQFQWKSNLQAYLQPPTLSIYFSTIDAGYTKLWRINIESKEIELLLDDAVFGSFNVFDYPGFLTFSKSYSNQPYELFAYDLNSKKLSQLTHFSDEVTAELDMNRAEEFWFTGALGDSVHGFLTLPPEFDSSQKYPLVLLIHGGPQWCWLGDFNYYGWNTQLMAAQGYVVAQIDPHGSVGYGLKFKEYVSGNWGKGDYEDLMKGVDYLIDTHSYIDSTRMAALGRSYGGFMANWICGHTNRFKCLVSIDGTYNHLSKYGSTEELWFPEWEFKGTPWDNREEYVRSSPMTYAAKFMTPTMVIHGQKDYRVDLSEGLQMFTALQRMGVPSQLLYFPDEGHNVGKLKNLRHVYEKQFEWLKRWLAP